MTEGNKETKPSVQTKTKVMIAILVGVFLLGAIMGVINAVVGGPKEETSTPNHYEKTMGNDAPF